MVAKMSKLFAVLLIMLELLT